MDETRYIILDAHDDEALHRNSDVPHHLMPKHSKGSSATHDAKKTLSDELQTTTTEGEAQSRASALSKPLREAAVLLPLVFDDNQWHLLFIRRARNVRDRHSGQVAFPGGRRDASDQTLVDTALRETGEEIGVPTHSIEVIGTLEHYVTVSHYQVAPVVGVLTWPQTLTLEVAEVDRAFLIPLRWLKLRENFTLRARKDMDPQSAQRHPIIVYNEYDGEILWGASARMTLNFLKALDQGDFQLPAAKKN